MRKILGDQYNVRLVSVDANSKNDPSFRLFDTEESISEDDGFMAEEVDGFFKLTKRSDKSSKNVIPCWRKVGFHRFPNIFLAVQDSVMAMGSSVSSEPSFSESDEIVSGNSSHYSDEKISRTICMQSWNCHLALFDK